MIDFPNVLDDIHTNLKNKINRGLVSFHILELSNIDAHISAFKIGGVINALLPNNVTITVWSTGFHERVTHFWNASFAAIHNKIQTLNFLKLYLL